MALTLLEAAKLAANHGEVFRAGLIEMYAQSSDLLRVLPFQNIQGNAMTYNREQTLPGIGFRGVNEGYTESTGVVNPITEKLAIAGGDLDVDRFLIDTGAGTRETHERMKVKALAHSWTRVFIKGDAEANPREFDGLQKRVSGDQRIENSAGAGGPLSLFNLDVAIGEVDGPTHLLMNKRMQLRLSASAHATSVGGNINWTPDEFGRRIMEYAGLPVLVVDEDETGAKILPFTEAAAGGGTASTSIYVVAFQDGMLGGIQTGPMDVRDLGEIEAKPVMRTRVEWYAGIAVYHGRSVARLRGITDAPAVV